MSDAAMLAAITFTAPIIVIVGMGLMAVRSRLTEGKHE